MQETIAYDTMMMTVGLVLALPRIGIGRYIGPGAVAVLGVLVLLWLDSLRRQGVSISSSQFVLVDLPVTIPTLGLSLLILLLTMS
jgi:Na+/H+ antiporter NhaD/arsenite permease-like protein